MTRRDPEDYPRVFNRAPAQRADGLVGHGGRELRTRLRNRTPSRASCRVDAASPYRASGLVLWPVCDMPGADNVCSLGDSVEKVLAAVGSNS